MHHEAKIELKGKKRFNPSFSFLIVVQVFARKSSEMAYHSAHVDVEELEETWKASEDMMTARSLL